MKLLITRPGEVHPEALLRSEGVTQGGLLSVVLYGMSLYLFEEKSWASTYYYYSHGALMTSAW